MGGTWIDDDPDRQRVDLVLFDDYVTRSGLGEAAERCGVRLDEQTPVAALGWGAAEIAALVAWSAADAGCAEVPDDWTSLGTVGDLYQTHLALRLLGGPGR